MSRVSLQTLLDRSIRNMGSGINNVVKESTLEMIKRAYAEGINVQISSGFRSFAEQKKLFNQGRTTHGNIVTNARAGFSNHNFGLAVDYFLTDHEGKIALWTVNAQWRRVAAIGKILGFKWGGDWTGFKDYPHLEMMGGLTMAQLRAGRRPTLKLNFTPTKVEDVKTEIGGEQVTSPEPSIPTPTGSPFIRSAQGFMNSRGYPEARKGNFTPLVVDGVSGPLSKNAVIRIAQYFGGTTVDGLVGPKTLKATATIRRDSTSTWWNHLTQSALNLHGAQLAVDGLIGPASERAIKAFQKANRLTQDGIVGPKTWEQLFK